jgi:PhoH-like ATPase
MQKNIYILDTCVLLYDHSAYKKFGEHNVIIPACVLDELDQFKKGNETINYEAREFIRVLDDLADRANNMLDDWIDIGDNLGKIKVSFEFHESKIDAELLFHQESVDHRILNVALYYKEISKDKIILVSKDINLRVKGRALGIDTEDYSSISVKDTSSLYTGNNTIIVNDLIIDKFYEIGEIDATVINCDKIYENMYFILKSDNKSALGFLSEGKIKLIEKQNILNIKPRNAEQIFATHAILNDNIKIVSINGGAGTGKTLLAMAGAIAQKKNFHQIFIARPIVPLSNRDIGFLPGDIDSKIAPYMEPLKDAIGFIKSQYSQQQKENKSIETLIEKEKIVIAPLAFIRGRSLHNILFIVDEAQNLSPIEIKTIISRMGENSKIIFTGDIQQIDSPWLDSTSNGLSYMIEKLKGEKIFGHITLTKGERSEIATLAANKL